MEQHPRLIEVDGSKKSGSGTILRLSVALSAITEQQLHVYNIRQNRPQPGLRPQHLEAVLTAAKLCNAEVEGAKIDSRELWFRPKQARGGRIEAQIGTAGSISMLLMTVLPICAHAESRVDLSVSKGGTDVSNSPTINYMRFVFLPTLQRMGLNAYMNVNKYGYYPRGNGEVTVEVEPTRSLKALQIDNFGTIKTVKGVSVCTFLAERRVAERQSNSARSYLKDRGYIADVQIVNDASNPFQKGSSIVLWAEADTGAVLGADAIGEPKKASEKVGEEAAQRLFEEISARPTVDVHLADMLVPYVALAKGKSAYLTRRLTEHVETNIWLSEEILNVRFNVQKTDGLYKIEKME